MRTLSELNEDLRALKSANESNELRSNFFELVKSKFGYRNIKVRFWSSSDYTVEEKEITISQIFSEMVDWVLFQKGVHNYKPEIEGLDFFNLDTLLSNGVNYSLNMSMELFEESKSLRQI